MNADTVLRAVDNEISHINESIHELMYELDNLPWYCFAKKRQIKNKYHLLKSRKEYLFKMLYDIKEVMENGVLKSSINV